MAPLIEVKDLYKSYFLGETRIDALKGVQLKIERGEFTALIGPSGSGKSTLLNLLGCLDRPDSGNIIIDEMNSSLMTEDQLNTLRNEKLGFIFQNFHLIPVLNVYENVELPLMIQKHLSPVERKLRVEKALEEVGLKDFIHHPPEKLSGGQRQRASIARSLVTNPVCILADEPTANLDSKTAHQIIDLLKNLNTKNSVTFLFCTHDEKLIGRVDRIIHIKDGLIS